jgi:rubrerythrin
MPAAERKSPEIVQDLYPRFASGEMSLVDLTWEQQCFHEHRRWSAMEKVAAVNLDSLSASDRHYIWNAGRAELTTKPGADRIARLADKECRRWQDKNPALAAVMQACGTWSRYWNEEEAYHETTLMNLAGRMGMEPVTDETFIEFRKIFPDDDMLRTLMLLAISEIIAANNYAWCAHSATDPGLVRLFKQIAADEIQHMRYFVAFAKALVDSGEYPARQAFAVAHLFLREEGELYGSERERREQRETHVNWWDNLKKEEGIVHPDADGKKEDMVLKALHKITGIQVNSAAEVERKWMELVGC